MQNSLVRNEMIPALAKMVSRLLASSGLNSQDVGAIIESLYATDAQAVEAGNETNLVTPKAAKLMAEKVLADWTSLAPDSLDQLEEIAAALNNDPDAFNTLKAAVDGLRGEINAYGKLAPIPGNSTEGLSLFSTTWINYESKDNGQYHAYASGTVVGNSVEVGIDNSELVDVIITIIPYSLSPAVGEEDRKIVRWEATQKGVKVYREIDTLMGAGTNTDWALIAGGGTSSGGDADSSWRLTPVADFTSGGFDSAAGIEALADGVYFATVTGVGPLTWIQYNEFNPSATFSEQIGVTITVSSLPTAGKKLASYMVHTAQGHYFSVYDTNTLTHQYVQVMDADAIASGFDDVYTDVAGAFSIMGYEVGQVVEGMHNRTYAAKYPGAASGNIRLTFTADGEINVTGSKNMTYYWKPYGATVLSSDYQLRMAVVSGSPGAGTTVTTSYGPVAGAVLDFDLVLASGTSGIFIADLTFRHVATGTESVVRTYLSIDIS